MGMFGKNYDYSITPEDEQELTKAGYVRNAYGNFPRQDIKRWKSSTGRHDELGKVLEQPKALPTEGKLKPLSNVANANELFQANANKQGLRPDVVEKKLENPGTNVLEEAVKDEPVNTEPFIQPKVNEQINEEEVKPEVVKKEEEPKKEQKKARIKSILEAYSDGELSKGERDYLIADTLGTFARNLGKDIGNVAAAYSGGTANTERDKSLWDSKNKEMVGAISRGTANAAEADIKGSDKAIERLKTIPAQRFMDDAAKLRAQGRDSEARVFELIGAGSTQEIGPEEYGALLYASDPEIQALGKELVKTATNTAGAVGGLVSGINDVLGGGNYSQEIKQNQATGNVARNQGYNAESLANRLISEVPSLKGWSVYDASNFITQQGLLDKMPAEQIIQVLSNM